MNDKNAIEILQNLENKYPLSEEEKEAINTAMGMLSWSAITEQRLKAKGEKLRKEKEANAR
jgi:hypothetical protein